MDAKELRIGNYLNRNGIVVQIDARSIFDMSAPDENAKLEYEPIPINEGWLLRFGFKKAAAPNYVNGYKYWLQVLKDYGEDVINRDGVWFVGIGTTEANIMVVVTLCASNYCANNVEYVHQLQNLYHALTGEELKQ